MEQAAVSAGPTQKERLLEDAAMETSGQMAFHFSQFPEEIKLCIFLLLDKRSLGKAASVCHDWHKIIEDEALWKKMSMRIGGQFQLSYEEIKKMGWRRYTFSREQAAKLRWSSTHCKAVSIGQNGLDVTAKGRGRQVWGSDDIAFVSTQPHLFDFGPQKVTSFYFEITVLSNGRGHMYNYMGLGFVPAEVTPRGMIGWYDNSYGWHSEDGLMHGPGGIETFKNFSSKETVWGKHDVVGCGYHNGVIFFTKNGKRFGDSWSGVTGQFYPCVTIMSPDQSFATNFGMWPFRYNPQKYMQQLQEEEEKEKKEITQ
jgi:hypothetical protein